MKVEEFVKNNLDNLEHFIEQGAWPLGLSTDKHDLLKLKAFTLDSKNRIVKIGEFHPRLLAAFYKFKYEETNRRFHDLRSNIETLVDRS